MSESTNINHTKSFWIISVLALLWNLIALMPLYTQVFISPEALAAMPDAERALYETSPTWMNTIFAIAVFGGIIGCILLLMRKALAITIFLTRIIHRAKNQDILGSMAVSDLNLAGNLRIYSLR